MRADVVVAGLGVTGSAAAWQLARRGKHVVGLDRFRPPHTLGSSHGGSRVIREMAFEHPRYVPIVRRAFELWHDLEVETGRSLVQQTGALYIGSPDSAIVAGSRASATAHGVASEELTAAEVEARWPAFRPDRGMVGLLELRAGILRPESCVEMLLAAATRQGAVLRLEEPMLGWTARRDGLIEVKTPRETLVTEELVLAMGPWMQTVLAELGVAAEVERVVQHWFAPARDAALLEPDRCPIFIWEVEDGVVFYGFPLLDGAVKAAVHHRGEMTTADTVRRDVSAAEVERTRSLLARYVPPAAGAHARSAVCLYTNAPDGHFIVDRHPEHHGVILASPCAGIGFKFAPAIGELIADLALDAPPRFDPAPFSLSRFG